MDITWVKSIYYRDVSSGQQGVPCTGIGYYVNLGYADGPWNATLNYGDFYPLYTGTAPDQRVQHRGLVKVAYRFAEPLQVYSVLIVENGGYIAQENERSHTGRRAGRIPVHVLSRSRLAGLVVHCFARNQWPLLVRAANRRIPGNATRVGLVSNRCCIHTS